MKRQENLTFLSHLMGAVLFAFLLAAASPIAAPGQGVEPPEKTLSDLLQSLKTLKSDPAALARIEKWISQEETKTKSDLEALDAKILEIRQSIDRVEKEKDAIKGSLERSLGQAGARPGNRVDYNRDIRPILSANCFACHGPDEKQRKAGLRLDDGECAYKPLESGQTPLVPGDRNKSELFCRITASDSGERMPPPKSQKTLAQEQIDLLGKWIDQGARYEKHWAFVRADRPPLPEPKNATWPKNEIDRFILAKLDEAEIAPNPQADRRKLIRRAYFDLVGLPPTPEAVESFLNDPSPDAYSRLVDNLLSNPHFGERWARHWLDVARFAESHGYEQDYNRDYAYHYRDFVIKAFNQDLPYDTFVKWQIAGDEIEPDNPLAMMATGFLAAGVHSTQITKNQVEKERYDELDDMTRTMGTAMLGLTIGCARCHDHKYDPIPTKDYYRLLSTFTTTVRSEVGIDAGPEVYEQAKALYDEDQAGLVADLEAFERDDLPSRFQEWLKSSPKPAEPPKWEVLAPFSYRSQGGASLTSLGDGSLLAGGKNPESDTYTFVATTGQKGITGVRLEALTYDTMPKGGPGRTENGNFALSNFRITAEPLSGEGDPAPLKLINPKATFEQDGLTVAAAIDDDTKTAWAIDPQTGKDHSAVFEIESPAGYEGGTLLKCTLEFKNNSGHNIGRPRLSVTATPPPLEIEGNTMPEQVRGLLAQLESEPKPDLSEERQAILRDWYKTTDDRWKQLHGKVTDHEKKAPQPGSVKVLVSSEGVEAVRTHTQGGDFFPETYFLKRGDPNQKEAVATQGFLHALMKPGLDETHWQVQPPQGWRTSYRRRSLSNWITDTEDGAGYVLARVIVNRLWQHHMGRGIVATPNDFGFQGEWPTHPELLDWLANELISNGWHLKPIHKLIMTSATYMQSAADDEKKAAADKENRLFWRFPRQRLEAEVLRDSFLSLAGMLDEQVFGPSTLDLDQKRRSIYFMVKRSKLIPMMTLFDAPDSLQSIAQRPRTTVATQALLVMNNPIIRDYASHFADRIRPKEGDSLPDAIRSGYRLALSRDPDSQELVDSLAFLEAQAESYHAAGKENAADLALADFCQVLMGLNEFVYVD
jgi:mono/diheme cytochrome c family protein